MMKKLMHSLLALVLTATSVLAMAAPPGAVRTVVGKPVAPIAIRYELAAPPALGRTLEIAVTVVSDVALDDVTVTLAASDGLVIGASQAVRRVGPLERGAPWQTSVSVTPLVLDALYLTVTVEGRSDGPYLVRTVLVPVTLAAAKSRSPATLKPDAASGGVVHSLPAIESPSDRLR